jgi:1,4-dihydroxy-2-naphthoate octaprenyltransferase
MSFRDYVAVARAPFLVLPVTLVAAGTGAAAFTGRFDLGAALWALIGLVALHAAVNALNEASDYKTGIDFETERTPFSGGSGTLPSGRLGYRAALGIGVAGSTIGLVVGIKFLAEVGWTLVPIVILGAIAVLSYTGLLARAYVGEIFAGLGLGLLPVLGTYLVQTGEIDAVGVVAGLPAFFMTFNLLLLNEFPDEKADRRGGRRNLVLLLGRSRAAHVYIGAVLMVLLSVIVSVLQRLFPLTALLALTPALLLVPAFRWALGSPQEPVPHGALGANVGWILLTNLVLAGSFLL